MSTAEPVLAPPIRFADAAAALDERTLSLLQRRSETAKPLRRGWLVRRALLVADVLGLTLGFLVPMAAFEGRGAGDVVAYRFELLVFLLTIPGWIILAKLYRLYDADEERTDHSTADELLGVFHLVTVGTWVFFAAGAVTRLADPSIVRLLTFWGLAVVFITSFRGVARLLCRRSTAYLQNTIVVGAGDVGQLVARKLVHHQEYGVNVVGFVDDDPRELRPGLEHVAVLGSPASLPTLVKLLDVERVVIAFSNDSHEKTLDTIRMLKDADVQIDVVPRLFEVLGSQVNVHTAEGVPLLSLPPRRLARSSLLLKRTMDLVLATAGLIVLAPLFLAVAIWIKLDSPGPVFFRQVRMGFKDETFRIYKFRSMGVDAEARKAQLAALNKHSASGGDPRMFKIAGDPRVTRSGKWLRRLSIDELPQLFNVLLGHMSLVGPRPLILEEDEHVVAWKRRRLNLKPGITGLWQVLGRDDIPFEEMVRLDYIYVTTWSLMHDLKLILRTLPALARTRNAY